MAVLNRVERCRHNASVGMKRSAEKRRCPKCNRKGAVKKLVDGDYVQRTCRFCGWCRGHFVGTGIVTDTRDLE